LAPFASTNALRDFIAVQLRQADVEQHHFGKEALSRDDGRFTIFVPSVPTPFAGAVYVLGPERVHMIDVPFTQAIKTITQWGSGSRELVAAMPKKISTFKPQSRVTG